MSWEEEALQKEGAVTAVSLGTVALPGGSESTPAVVSFGT